MYRSLAGLCALAAMLASVGCGGLPKNVKSQVEAERKQFASARAEFQKARDEVKKTLTAEPDLAKIRGLLWQPALDRDTARFNSSESELQQLEALVRKDDRRSSEEVERLLAGEKRLRTEALADVKTMQGEAQRFTVLKANLARYDHEADQLAATDLAPVATVVQKAETDWPEKKTDLDRRLAELKASETKAADTWRAARKSAGGKPDYAALFTAEEQLQSEASTLPQQVESLRSLTGQLYTSWDKLLVDLSDKDNQYREKIRTIRTRYTDVAAGKSDISNEERWTTVSRPEYLAMENNIGMAIEHKAAGKYDSEVERTPQPPGYSYIAPPSQGHNQYGYWSGGIWTWLPQYLIMRDLLFHNSYQPIPSYEYESYRNARNSGQVYYGRDEGGQPKFGSHGTFTQRRYTSSQYVQQHGGAFGSSGYSSRGSSGSPGDSGRRFGTRPNGSNDGAGRTFGSGGRSFGSGSPGRTFGSRPGRSFGGGGRSFGGRRR